jgi:hypothetical protein
MYREKFLKFHGVDSKAWARRHGIEPATADCYHCGAELTTTIPIACQVEGKKLYGLIAPTCACGSEDTPYCIVGLFND